MYFHTLLYSLIVLLYFCRYSCVFGALRNKVSKTRLREQRGNNSAVLVQGASRAVGRVALSLSWKNLVWQKIGRVAPDLGASRSRAVWYISEMARRALHPARRALNPARRALNPARRALCVFLFCINSLEQIFLGFLSP